MKKLITVFLILAMLLPVAALAVDLTETEQKYVGVWVMYATNGSATYNYSLTFAEDRTVFFHTMRVIGGEATNNSTTQGFWKEMGNGKVEFSFGGQSAVCEIGDEGYLVTMLLPSYEGMGLYYKCPDMAPIMGWW